MAAAMGLASHGFWAAIPIGSMLGIALFKRRNRTQDALATLLPEPAPEGQFRGFATYRHGDVVLGGDPVALVLVDGWLHAEGVRSHFAVSAEDVREVTESWDDTRTTLALREGSEISLAGIGREGHRLVERWHRARIATDGESTFPPSAVHPQQFARWASYVVFGLVLQAAQFLPWATILPGYVWVRHLFALLALGLLLKGGIRLFRIYAFSIKRRIEKASLPQGAPPQADSAFEMPTGRRLEDNRTEVRNL